MSWFQMIKGALSGVSADVTADNRLKVQLETDAANNSAQVGAVRFFSENDPGEVTGEPYLASPETDDDYRLRVAQDAVLDSETFNYTAQNTGKHQYRNTTMTQSWGAGGVVTNNGNITTTTTGVQFNTYAEFPLLGAMTLYAEWEMSFSASLPPANTVFEIGLGRYATANPYAPTDGAYLLANASGYQLVINHNGTLSNVAIAFTPTANRVYQFVLSISEREVDLWIDDVRYAAIITPVGQGQPYMSSTLPFGWRHVITGGAAGGAYSVTIRDYNVTSGGFQVADELKAIGNRVFGGYQGLSGGTMGSLANYANNANPTAAVPTNTTAALGTGLGGQFWETASLAVNTDGVIWSYQVPAGTANVQGKRLVLKGIYHQSHIQTVIAGGPFVKQYSLAFGHTAVSLATAEAAATKAPRRIALPAMTQLVTAAQAVSTMVSQPGGAYQAIDPPIYVNPGEFVALVCKHIGTVGTSGTIAHVSQPVYGWE